jgi:hypothetical protein
MIDELKEFERMWLLPNEGVVLAFTWSDRRKQRRNPKIQTQHLFG